MYICPMHPNVRQKKPGLCSICGMDLVQKSEKKEKFWSSQNDNSYKPLFIILFFILLTSLVLTIKDIHSQAFSLQNSLRYGMAGFFLVFSGFKLLDLRGFAIGYNRYDLLAQRIVWYGYIYPFFELFLGLSYLVNFTPPAINAFTFFLMGFSGLGVLIKVLKKEKFYCACLGTFLKVPLTTVTLVEDVIMALMALAMLIM